MYTCEHVHMCMLVPVESERSTRYPRTRVTGNYEPPATWILGNGFWTVEAANALSHRANSPGPTVIFNYIISLIFVFSFSHKGSNQCKNLEICTFLQTNKFLA